MKKGADPMALQDQSIGTQNVVKKYDSKIVCFSLFCALKKGAGWAAGRKAGKQEVQIPADTLKQPLASF